MRVVLLSLFAMVAAPVESGGLGRHPEASESGDDLGYSVPASPFMPRPASEKYGFFTNLATRAHAGARALYGYDTSYSKKEACNLIVTESCSEKKRIRMYNQSNYLQNPMRVLTGNCKGCGYGTSADWLDNDDCYACETGWHIAVVWDDCTGYCVNKTDVKMMKSMGYLPMSESSCEVYSGRYPLDTSGGCSSYDDGATCFSGEDTVDIEGEGPKLLREVRVGDSVLSANAKGEFSFSPVVAVPHGPNVRKATLVALETSKGKVLRLTKLHLLPRCDGSLAYAGSLVPGDCLRTIDGDEPVERVGTVPAVGLFTAVPALEYLVVNGVVASPFALSHGLAGCLYTFPRKAYPVLAALRTAAGAASAYAQTSSAALALAVAYFVSLLDASRAKKIV